MQRSTWMVGAAALGICIGGTALAADQAGWAVRICRGQTEASAIKITVGDGKAQKELVNWQSDNKKTDFPVPAPLAMAKKLTVDRRLRAGRRQGGDVRASTTARRRRR